MPVNVSLKSLFGIKDARHLWPGDVEGFVAGIEAEPADRTRMAGFTDWLFEHDEHDLYQAVKWLSTRPEVEIRQFGQNQPGPMNGTWKIDNPPRILGYGGISGEWCGGVASLLAALADRLAEVRAELT